MSKTYSCFSSGFLLIIMLFCTLNSVKAQESTTNYLYDDVGRLKAVISPNGEVVIYEYDAAGNLTVIRRETNTTLTIIDFTPRSGSFNSVVTIYGTGFSSDINENTVSFNGAVAPIISALATKLIVRVPIGATTGKIQITSPNGSVQSSENYTIATRPQITNISPLIGKRNDPITIEGINFDLVAENNELLFNNQASSTITSVIADTILTKVPDLATSGRITLNNPAGTAVSDQDFFVVPNGFNTSDVNSNSTARLSYGETKTITFAGYNKLGLLVFDGTAGQKVGLRVTVGTGAGGTLNPNLMVSINRPDGAIVIPATPLTAAASGVVIEPFILPVTGTYTIQLDKSLYPTTSGNAQVQLSYVPDDGIRTIETNGSTTNVSVNAAGQNMPIAFNGIAGQRLRLDFSNVSIVSGSISLLDPTGTSLVTVPLNLRGHLIDISSLPLSGRYIILIQTNLNQLGSLNLTASVVSSAAVIPINQNGQYVTPVVTGAGQNPQLTFNGTIGQRVSLGAIRANNLSGDATIKNPDGTVLNSKFSVFSSVYSLPTTNYDTLFLTGTHTISIAATLQGSVGSATLSLTNSLPKALQAMSFPGSIGTYGDTSAPNRNEGITFDGVAGRKISLRISIPQNSNSIFKTSIYAPDGSLLQDGYTNSGLGAIDGITLPLTGRYLIFLDPYDNYYVRANLGLTDITNSTDITGTILPNGASVTVQPVGDTIQPQNVRLTFNGIAGQQVYLTGDRLYYGNAGVSLLSPDNSVLGTSISLGTTYSGSVLYTGNTGVVTLPQAGVYTVLVSAGSGIVPVRVNLSDVSQNSSISIGGAPVPVSIVAPGQNAFLTFTGAAGQHVKLETSNVTPIRSKVTIYKPDGTSFENFPSGYSIGDGSIGTSGGTVDVPRLPVDGTYTIVVNPESDYIGSMTLTLSEVNDVTTNATIGGAATPINITTPYQNAKITFAATRGQHLKMSLNNVTLNGFMYIYKPDGTLLTASYAGVYGTSGTLAYPYVALPFVPDTGTYTMFIDPQGNSTGSAQVSLADFADPTQTVVANGSSVNVNVIVAGSNPRLTISGNKGQHLRLVTNNLASGSILIYKSNGETLFGPTYSYPDNRVYDVPFIPATDTYTIVADMRNQLGNVTFTLQEVPDETITVGGSERVINFAPAGQNARLAFNGVQGQRVAVGLRENFSQGAFVSVINANGIVIKEPVLVSGTQNSGEGVLEDVVLPATEIYYIVIAPNFGNVGTATVKLYNTPEITAAMTIGTPISININPGQNARLTFNGTAGQRVTEVLGKSATLAARVKLIAPDGIVLKEVPGPFAAGLPGNTIIPSQTLPLTGIYTLYIDPSGANTGGINIIVTNP